MLRTLVASALDDLPRPLGIACAMAILAGAAIVWVVLSLARAVPLVLSALYGFLLWFGPHPVVAMRRAARTFGTRAGRLALLGGAGLLAYAHIAVLTRAEVADFSGYLRLLVPWEYAYHLGTRVILLLPERPGLEPLSLWLAWYACWIGASDTLFHREFIPAQLLFDAIAFASAAYLAFAFLWLGFLVSQLVGDLRGRRVIGSL